MQDSSLSQLNSVRLPTNSGEFTISVWPDHLGREHIALVRGDVRGQSNVLTRLHSECATGDLFGSLRCDCGVQLETALQRIGSKDCGVLLYLRQEGRGIGLAQKIKAYVLQDQGLDTVAANEQLGHQADEREYSFAASILRELGVVSVSLLSNNPAKAAGLRENGMKVDSIEALPPVLTRENQRYLDTKRQRMNHSFILPKLPV